MRTNKKGGNELTRYFCSDCGSPLFTSSPRHPDRLYVKAGAFDDPTLIQPSYQLDAIVGVVGDNRGWSVQL